MKYIGVRSSECLPHEDSNYWGSSKHLPVNVKDTHKKRILNTFLTRKEAVQHEIFLHNKYDVGISEMFYNKAKQTSTGFDTAGTKLPPFSKEHRKNLSKSIKKFTSKPDYKNPLKGIPLSAETKEKLSKSIKKTRSKKLNSEASPKFKPWFIEDSITGKKQVFKTLTKEDYAKKHNVSIATLKAAISRSKGTFVIKNGAYKNKILGNLEDYKNKQTPRQKRSWFITYPTYSLPFYFKTRKEYAEENGIKVQQVSDAIHLSNGVTPMKKGPFKGLILGRIE